MTARTLLRRHRSLIGNDATFLTADAIEVDSSQNYEMVRRRVFFDDVTLVTLHRERGIPFLVLTGIFAAGMIGLSILIVAIRTEAWPGALPFFTLGSISLTAFLIRISMGREVITVFGRRSRAVVRFGSFRKQRARDVYGQICAAVRRAQSAFASTAPPPAPDLSGIPMPPE